MAGAHFRMRSGLSRGAVSATLHAIMMDFLRPPFFILLVRVLRDKRQGNYSFEGNYFAEWPGKGGIFGNLRFWDV